MRDKKWCTHCGESATRKNPVAEARDGHTLCFRCYEEFADLFHPFMMRQFGKAMGVFMGALERSKAKAKGGAA